MGAVRVPILSAEARAALNHGYHHGKTHSFRQRCQMILLKSQRLTSKEVGEILGTCPVCVNTWLDRWEAKGISGLRTRPGQGKKPILDEQTDTEIIKASVTKNRQQLKLARIEAQEALNKEFSDKTLKRFLKKVADDGNASVSVHAMRPMKRSTPTKSSV